MYTATSYHTPHILGAVLAAAIVAFGALVLDQGHLASTPAGIVEIGPLTVIDTPAQIAALPEVVVYGAKA